MSSPPSSQQDSGDGPSNGIPRTIQTRSEEFQMRNISGEAPSSRGFKKESPISKELKKERDPTVAGPRKESFFVAKGSSDLKWQRNKMVVGALQVKSEPYFQPKEDMKPLYRSDGCAVAKSKFEVALQGWEDFKLLKSFIKACDDLPDSVCCCGLSQSDISSSIKQYVTLLNDGWVKHANKKLKTRGFKIDAFYWSWQNTSGKSQTSVLLIRFFELSTYKFRRASVEGSLDLDDMLLGESAKMLTDALDDSSHYSVSHNSGEDDLDPLKNEEQKAR